MTHVFEMPVMVEARQDLATVRVFTHKGEFMQGPIPIPGDVDDRYTMGVFSLLDNLDSAFVDVRGSSIDAPVRSRDRAEPNVVVQPNGWNDGEVSLVKNAVTETWRHLGPAGLWSYRVYGYHDIRVGAGSGSSSALAQAAIRATAAEHGATLSDDEVFLIQGHVEPGADPLHLVQPAVVATRIALGRPVRSLGERTPRFRAVAWSAGSPVRTSSIRFEYGDEDLLTWRVRWASVERAVRSEDHERVAVLAMASATENQARNPNADFALLEDAVQRFAALGFAVAHTGTYHIALFPHDSTDIEIEAFEAYVKRNTTSPPVDPRHFATAAAGSKRYSQS